MSKQRKRRPRRIVQDTLRRRARRGVRGYPLATVAYYGPGNRFASKVAVGIIRQEGGEVDFLERWFSEDQDVRMDSAIKREIVAFLDQHHVRSVAMTDKIIGCPHEEGIDYPAGENCPQCPYWANRDRWTGELISAQAQEGQPMPVVAGYAWYRPEQWELLRAVSADRDKLEETHEEWAANAEKALQGMREAGIRAEKWTSTSRSCRSGARLTTCKWMAKPAPDTQPRSYASARRIRVRRAVGPDHRGEGPQR